LFFESSVGLQSIKRIEYRRVCKFTISGRNGYVRTDLYLKQVRWTSKECEKENEVLYLVYEISLNESCGLEYGAMKFCSNVSTIGTEVLSSHQRLCCWRRQHKVPPKHLYSPCRENASLMQLYSSADFGKIDL